MDKPVTIVFEAEAQTSTPTEHMFEKAKIHFTGLQFADKYAEALRPMCGKYKTRTSSNSDQIVKLMTVLVIS